MTQLLVLAGGLGTRLREAVSEVPKALAPVGSVPFLQYQLETWIAQGVRSFVFLLHHQAEQIVIFLESNRRGLLKNCELAWVIEPQLLGTGGAVANAIRQLGIRGDFILTNADTWLVPAMNDMDAAKAPAMGVLSMAETSRYGSVRFDGQYRVIEFVEKQKGRRGWINAGIYRFSAAQFETWGGQPFSLESDFIRNLVRVGQLRVVPLQCQFIDIGVPEDYYQFCRWMENQTS